MLARFRVATLARPFSSSSRARFDFNDELKSIVSEQAEIQERQAAAPTPVAQSKEVSKYIIRSSGHTH